MATACGNEWPSSTPHDSGSSAEDSLGTPGECRQSIGRAQRRADGRRRHGWCSRVAGVSAPLSRVDASRFHRRPAPAARLGPATRAMRSLSDSRRGGARCAGRARRRPRSRPTSGAEVDVGALPAAYRFGIGGQVILYPGPVLPVRRTSPTAPSQAGRFEVLLRNRPPRGVIRRRRSTPSLPSRRPSAQPRPPSHRPHPTALRRPRPRLLGPEMRRGQRPPRGDALPHWASIAAVYRTLVADQTLASLAPA